MPRSSYHKGGLDADMVFDSTNTTATPPRVPPSADMLSLRFRDLRQNKAFAPGGPQYRTVVDAFLPTVLAVASTLVPENPEAAERIATAVFRTFAIRWRKPRRGRPVGVWLFQTTFIAAMRERKRLGLHRLTPKNATEQQAPLLRLYRLRPKLRDPVVLCELFQAPRAVTQKALRLSERRLEKQVWRGLKKLQSAPLNQFGPPPSPELTERIWLDLQEKQKPTPLVRETIWAWRWILLRGVVKRVLRAVAVTVCVLVTLGGVFAYLASTGALMPFFIRQGQKQMLKEFPEMANPATPWPQTDKDRELVPAALPSNSEEFFRTTNIWPVRLTFTPEQWQGIEPTRIPQVRNMFQNGRIILRNPNAKRSGLAGALGFDYNWVEGRLDFGAQRFDKVGVRYRGNGTYVNSLYGRKQSIKVDVNKFDKKNRLAGLHELNLLNTVVDYSFMHDPLAQQLFRDLGAVAPRTAYAYVTVEVPGKSDSGPRGLYVIVENIDSDFAEDRFGSKKVPIFKPVTYDLFEDIGDTWESYAPIYDLKTKATDEQKQRVIEFAKVVTHSSDDEFARRLPEFLDLEESAAFLAGHVLLSSYDGFLVNGQNYYVYLDPKSNRFGFIPWDQDHSWGDFGHIGSTDQRENASIWKPSTYDFRFLKRVMKVESFRTAYRNKLETALISHFTTEKLFKDIDALAPLIRPAVAAESEFRVKRFDQAISDQWVPGSRDGVAEGPQAPVHQIKRFITNRIQSVREQLDGKREGATMGGFR